MGHSPPRDADGCRRVDVAFHLLGFAAHAAQRPRGLEELGRPAPGVRGRPVAGDPASVAEGAGGAGVGEPVLHFDLRGDSLLISHSTTIRRVAQSPSYARTRREGPPSVTKP